MYICRIQYKYKQHAGSCISVPVRKYYNLFYFPAPVKICVSDELINTRPHACIFSEPMQPRWFQFEEDATIHWMHNFAELAPLLDKYRIPLNQVLYPGNPSFIADFFRKTSREFYENDDFREELLDGYVEEFLIKLSRSLVDPVKSKVGIAEQKLFQDLRWEILSHPEKTWTVEEMSKMVNLSTSRFHAVYKEVFGISPIKDVINTKIDRAKTVLIMDKQADLMAIAERFGYKNQYHFIRQFKAVTGMTPGVFRKQKV